MQFLPSTAPSRTCARCQHRGPVPDGCTVGDVCRGLLLAPPRHSRLDGSTPPIWPRPLYCLGWVIVLRVRTAHGRPRTAGHEGTRQPMTQHSTPVSADDRDDRDGSGAEAHAGRWCVLVRPTDVGDGLPGEEDRHLAGPHRLRRRHPRPVRLGEAAGGSHRRCTGHPAGAAVAAARRPPTDASPAREPAAAPGEAAERQAPEGGEEGRREASRLGPRGLLPLVGRPTRLPHDLRLGAGAAPARHHPLPRPAHAPRWPSRPPPGSGSGRERRARSSTTRARTSRSIPEENISLRRYHDRLLRMERGLAPKTAAMLHCLGGHRHGPRRPAAAAPPPRGWCSNAPVAGAQPTASSARCVMTAASGQRRRSWSTRAPPPPSAASTP